jgi:Fe2+ or Zn2+ uptake regulation protein
MNTLNTLVTEDRRLAVLTLLADSHAYQAGAPMLQMVLAGLGHAVALETVLADLTWLRDAGLVSLREVGGVHIATLSGRGLDVATDRTQVPGVARPRPE